MANARLPPDGDPIEHAEGLIASGRAAEAASFLQARIAAGRGGLLARLCVVRALLAAGDAPVALAAARETAQLNPNVVPALLALGDALLAAGHLPTAIAEYQRALRLDAASDDARLKLGLAWLEAGEADKALEQFAAVDPDAAPDLPAHIARAQAVRVQQRSDAGYVRHLFDQFSADYDARMRGQLTYRAPEILLELAGLVMPGAEGLAILDLGCGTGLAGAVFADLGAAIDGIDLSPAMIEKARRRELYRKLAVADIESAPAEGGADYDLVLAADTVVYLGDLSALIAGVTRRLKPGGFFLFTVETSSGADFELGPKRRWRHGEGYLRKIAADAALDVAGIVTCSPRTEANVLVEGLAVAFSKPG